MTKSLSINIRLELANHPGALAGVCQVIAGKGGNVGNITMIANNPSYDVRELAVRLKDAEVLDDLVAELSSLPDIRLVNVADRVMAQHRGGKIQVLPRTTVENWDDLAVVYTPGVAGVSEAIAQDRELAYSLTMKNNSVAIVTDGSAVLGLGNVGPAAALPVMEGKAVLFKKFADIDAFPICLDVHEPEEIIKTVQAIAPAFGGINLEDIGAPRCFEVEERLSQLLDIPVFHDDQRGTAIVVLAGLLNALKVVGKKLQQVKIVICGAGAAGTAITWMLLDAGATDIIVCDRKGAIARDDNDLSPYNRRLAERTNQACRHGSVREVVAGADVFIGVSGPNVLLRENVAAMAKNPIVFALANPEPEIDPEAINDLAAVVATGRSDYPNQINNALVFPGLFRGALNSRAGCINKEMCLEAAHALARLIPEAELSAVNIIPSIFQEGVVAAMAEAVEGAARRTGVAKELPALKKCIYSV